MKTRRVVLILLLLAAAGGGAWYWFYGGMNRNTSSIAVSGNLELTQVDLSFKTAGRMTLLAVREGDLVKKGDLIAKLDSAQLDQQLLRDQAAVASAQSSLQQLRTSIEYQQATLESDISTRRAELAQAQAKLDELMAGSRPQEIQQAQSGVADAKAWNDQARLDMERAQTLFAREDISKSQFDQARAKLDSTAAQLKQAEDKLALVKEGPRAEEIAGARAQVARAQAAVQTAEANRIEIRRKQQELAARQSEIERTRAQVGMTQTQIADATVVAPIDGVVLVKAAEAGEVIAAGSTIVSLGDLDHPWLRAYINETDLGRIKVGGKARLSTDSFPGKTYDGHISFIASEAEFTPKQIQTKEERVKLVYRIKIDVDNAQHELKNNMPVDAEILL
jgi:HlyD family secretion protein